ncbi:hypothetical protein D4764_0157060 [Takifugu flavidus]|uniref:Ig-like domain-containing protein n=1 Tax=Takifugu flavidus TaxID=433684 RepID=A0A5C6MF22_9TELE|nr:hypothetical protein D4764_0157060 [Takifugu flavidus]
MKGAQRGSLEVTLDRDLCVLKGASAVINCRADGCCAVELRGGRRLHQADRVSGCPTPVDIVWFKDGKPVRNVFVARREDTGRYHCAVWRQEDPPDRVTLTISSPGNVVRGSSVVLTCHSDASPPVRNNGYSLYREGRFIGSGQNYTIPDVQPDHSGRYHCQAWNSISSRGVDHFNSSAVLLQVYCTYLDINSTQHISDDDDVTVWDPVLLPDVPENISITINPAHVVWGSSSVTLTCSSDANPPADTYIWYRNTNSSSSNGLQVGSGQVLSIPSMEALHSGLYLCQARNQVGGKNSTEVLLAMVDEEQRGSQTLPAVVGIGLALIVALVVALFLFCRWKKRRLHQKALDESNVIYSNIQRPDSALPDVARHTIPSSSSSQSPASIGGEVTYSLVNIKSRDLEGLSDSPDVQGSRSKGKNSIDSVIYATISPR